MRQLAVIAILVALVVGCTKEAPPPAPAPKATPVLTPEDIAKEIRTSTAFLGQWLGGARPPDVDKMIRDVATAVAKHRGSDNGKVAISQVSHDVEEVIRQAREQKRWPLVMAGIQVYGTLNTTSTKYNRLKEMAQIQINRPKVTLKGFFIDQAANNEVYAFVEVVNPATGEVTSKQVRVGEEFENLRFVRIIGEQKGIELEYLPIPGDTFNVMK